MQKREAGGLNKKAQLTVFIIVGLLIVAGVAGFFLIKNRYINSQVPEEFKEVYDYYESCVKAGVEDGAKILGTKAGYIENPEFIPGSEYAPFSNQFNFFGEAVPYWYYISANGIAKEQIPSKKIMEEQLANYLVDKIKSCNLEVFSMEGYEIETGEAKVKTKIETNKIDVQLNQRISLKKEDKSVVLNNLNFESDSRLGEFYDTARKLYDYEKNKMFLENYSQDVLYTYAPVSGAEISCSPLVWNAYEVFGKLRKALEANLGVLKVNGDYFSSKNTGDYFVVGKGSDLSVKNKQVNFLYSKEWPSRFEVWPTQNNIMTASPVGTQEGLSALGFCYVPYKFVYDMYFPVMIQIFSNDGEQLFQFPFAVVIQKNQPRQAMKSEYFEEEESICENANKEITINTYNTHLDPVEADISFKCLSSTCSLGKTKIDNATGRAELKAKVPQCVNGILFARNAPGYSEKKYIISTNEEETADIILDKEKGFNVEIYVDNQLTNNAALLTVTSNNENISNLDTSLNYPMNKKLEISEGDYKFELKVYKSGSVNVPATTNRQCSMLPREGILGLLGFESEKCFDINIPSQTIENLFYAGGKTDIYISQSEIDEKITIKIYADSSELPSSVEEIGVVYDKIERSSIRVEVA